MSKHHARDLQREAFWKKIIRDPRSSNEPIRAYCQRLRISEAAYLYWQRELMRLKAEILPVICQPNCTLVFSPGNFTNPVNT
ncbi:hypothetical protein KIH39_15370 [Telmatocola sphagniphila]|uniref:Transposase n=1 Tax=Telmatocola sphagniphila TaxID=1123043 RepID=A0A8E6ETP8_9BACT|nr:hypothetical protein [Telmatocola sphagniphila]QVL30232.1 hypothetical protein KIH39_15370 [Telmatocola sphagniphila]